MVPNPRNSFLRSTIPLVVDLALIGSKRTEDIPDQLKRIKEFYWEMDRYLWWRKLRRRPYERVSAALRDSCILIKV
jgi:hypothetical protein